MRIMLIFLGGYYVQPTPGSGAETRPPRRLDTAPRRPPSDPMPRQSGGAPALATVSTRAAAGATLLLQSSPCL